jgi:uncharacterized RDD family membrane protein YckC
MPRSPTLPLRERARALMRRGGAMVYDGLLLVALLICITVPVVIARQGAVPPGSLTYQFAVAAVVAGFYLISWIRQGQTVGMRAWQLVVERPDRSRVDLAHAVARLITSLLSLAPLGAGYLWMLVDREGLAWHDRLSGTRVVYRRLR